MARTHRVMYAEFGPREVFAKCSCGWKTTVPSKLEAEAEYNKHVKRSK